MPQITFEQVTTKTVTLDKATPVTLATKAVEAQAAGNDETYTAIRGEINRRFANCKANTHTARIYNFANAVLNAVEDAFGAQAGSD